MIIFESSAGENNRRSKVTEEIVREIRRRKAAGENYKKLQKEYSEKYGITMETVRNIAAYKRWRHVKC